MGDDKKADCITDEPLEEMGFKIIGENGSETAYVRSCQNSTDESLFWVIVWVDDSETDPDWAIARLELVFKSTDHGLPDFATAIEWPHYLKTVGQLESVLAVLDPEKSREEEGTPDE